MLDCHLVLENLFTELHILAKQDTQSKGTLNIWLKRGKQSYTSKCPCPYYLINSPCFSIAKLAPKVLVFVVALNQRRELEQNCFRCGNGEPMIQLAVLICWSFLVDAGQLPHHTIHPQDILRYSLCAALIVLSQRRRFFVAC